MMHVMVDVYRMDKAVVMEYQASQEGHIETGDKCTLKNEVCIPYQMV